MVIGIDFDGTCVTHQFPDIGEDIGAAPVLRELVKQGHQLVLFTMRSNVDAPTADCGTINPVAGNHLDNAVKWFEDHGIELYGVNVNPTQHTWTSSPKAYCQLYIDDAALGAPVKGVHGKKGICWIQVFYELKMMGILKGDPPFDYVEPIQFSTRHRLGVTTQKIPVKLKVLNIDYAFSSILVMTPSGKKDVVYFHEVVPISTPITDIIVNDPVQITP